MPRSLADFTASATQTLGPQLRFALPAQRNFGIEVLPVALTGALWMFLGFAGVVLGQVAIGLWIYPDRRFRGRCSPFAGVVIGFTDQSVVIADRSLRGRIDPSSITELALDDCSLRYDRTRLAVDTRLFINGDEWSVHGWCERDLREALKASPWQERLLPNPGSASLPI